MKFLFNLLLLILLSQLISCQEAFQGSLSYTPDDGINLNEIIQSDSLTSMGTYWLNDMPIASGYMISKKHYILAIKLDSVSQTINYKFSGNIPYKPVDALYSTIFGDKMIINYNTGEIHKNFPIKSVTCNSDDKILQGISNDSIKEFHVNFKKLTIHFNENESARLYMESDKGIMGGDILFYKRDKNFYLLFMSSRENYKSGTLYKYLTSENN